MKKGRMSVAIYERVSSDEQAREGISLEMQEQVCRKVAEQAGATSIELFCDAGFTGKHLKRPALQGLLPRLREFDMLLVWKLDRLCRKLRDRLHLIDLCLENGVRVRSATEPVDLDTVMGRAMIQMMGVFSEVEVGLLSERVLATQKTRLETVPLAMSKPPLGYTWIGKRDAWEVDPKEAAIVRRIFEMYAGGASITAIMQRLNAEGIKGKQGGTILGRGVKLILSNPNYIGEFRWNAVHSGEHEPIILLPIWQDVQARLNALPGIHPKVRERSLTPVLRCGVCDGLMGRQWNGRNSYYICTKRRRLPEPQRHDAIYNRAGRVEDCLWRHVEDVLEEGLVEAALEEGCQGVNGGDHPAGLELREVEIKLQRIADAYESGAYDAAMAAERTAPLMGRRDELKTQMVRRTAGQDAVGLLAQIRTASPAAFAAMMRKKTADVQLLFLQTLFQHVLVDRDGLRFIYKLPMMAAESRPWEDSLVVIA